MPLKLMIPAAVLIGGFVMSSATVYGTTEYARKEKKACTACHSKVVSEKTEMGKNLTDTGKCYRDNDHSLTKCQIAQK